MLSAMLRPVSPTSLVCAKVDWKPFLSKFGAGDFGSFFGEKNRIPQKGNWRCFMTKRSIGWLFLIGILLVSGSFGNGNTPCCTSLLQEFGVTLSCDTEWLNLPPQNVLEAGRKIWKMNLHLDWTFIVFFFGLEPGSVIEPPFPSLQDAPSSSATWVPKIQHRWRLQFASWLELQEGPVLWNLWSRWHQKWLVIWKWMNLWQLQLGWMWGKTLPTPPAGGWVPKVIGSNPRKMQVRCLLVSGRGIFDAYVSEFWNWNFGNEILSNAVLFLKKNHMVQFDEDFFGRTPKIG